MSKQIAQGQTYTVGYFNGNRWPLRIEISELGITLQLEPKQYILNREGMKINDPYFENYCGPNRLSREESDTPVPVIRVPKRAARIAQEHDGQSVREVTQFKEGPRGTRVPVIPQPRQIVRPADETNPVRGMSMEDARKFGFLRPTKEVPEDYGLSETQGVLPQNAQIPEIKYAMDSGRGKHQQGKIQIDEDHYQQVPEDEAKEFIQKLGGASAYQETDDPDQHPEPGDNSPQPVQKAEQPLPPPAIPGAKAKAEAPAAVSTEQNDLPEPPEEDELPEPAPTRVVGNVLDVDDDEEEALSQDSDEDGSDEEGEEAPEEQAREQVEEKSPQSKRVSGRIRSRVAQRSNESSEDESSEEGQDKYVCSADGQKFKFKHQLRRYARANFPDQFDEIMEPYADE